MSLTFEAHLNYLKVFMKFYDLKISKTKLATPDTIIVFFELTDQLKNDFQFKAGQYITISDEIEGEEVRRSYSICSVNWENELAVGIKRVDGGLMSNFIHKNYKTGQVVKISVPEGKFIVEPDDSKSRSHYFFAAGSGITPVYSMIRTLLEEEPLSKLFLLYGSRFEDSIIFKDELDSLMEKYSGQLEVEYSVTKPSSKKQSGLLGFLKPRIIDWKGYVGRINSKMIQLHLEKYPVKENDQFYICGPGNLIENTEEELKNVGVNGGNIHKEYFVSNTGSQALSTEDAQESDISVELNGESFSFKTDGRLTILEDIINLKKDPPYSCTSGACSSCLAKVSEGQVKMEVCYALEDDEVEQGYILTCQARAVSEKVSIKFE